MVGEKFEEKIVLEMGEKLYFEQIKFNIVF